MRLILFILLLAVTPAMAQEASAPVAGQETTAAQLPVDMEDRARALGRTLRCVVCQSESIEESDAQLAADMRAMVRELLAEGSTEEEITALMRDRYGDYVLLKPPVQANTIILWFGPPLAALIGLAWFVSLRRKRRLDPVDVLSEDERERLEALRRS